MLQENEKRKPAAVPTVSTSLSDDNHNAYFCRIVADKIK